MKNNFINYYLFFFLFFTSCQFNNYETIDKNIRFRQQIKTGEFLKLSKGYTYYEIKNKEAKKTLIFIHGFSVPSYIWDDTFKSASKRGYKTVRLDLYGRGYSSNLDSDYTDELFANQVIELMNELKIERATFLGLSNGGRVISKIAYLKPELIQKLVYVSSSSFQEHKPMNDTSVSGKEINDFIKNNYPSISKGQMLDFKYPQNFKGWDDKYEQLLQYEGFARALISTRKNHINLDLENKFINDSNIPLYTIWGDSDSAVVYNNFKNKLNKLMPRRIEYFISNSGHLPNMENSVEFEDILYNKILKEN
jgi:pimeloyl-ACP methyl ester carboxylesterase